MYLLTFMTLSEIGSSELRLSLYLVKLAHTNSFDFTRDAAHFLASESFVVDIVSTGSFSYLETIDDGPTTQAFRIKKKKTFCNDFQSSFVDSKLSLSFTS